MTLPLNIKYTWQPDFSIPGNYRIEFSAGNDESISAFLIGYPYNFTIGTPQDSVNNIFPTLSDAVAYYGPTASASIISDVNAHANNQYTLSGNIVAWLGYEDNRRLSNLETGKFDIPTGTTSQYVRGDGTLATLSTGGGTRTQSALTLSMVGTGATGTQIDATHDALINVTVSTSATATIAGAATSTVALKICATNNATEASWTTVQTSETSQSYSLAIALQGVTGGKGCLTSLVPAGWYAKLVNTGSGTHTETFISGQKTIFS